MLSSRYYTSSSWKPKPPPLNDPNHSVAPTGLRFRRGSIGKAKIPQSPFCPERRMGNLGRSGRV